MAAPRNRYLAIIKGGDEYGIHIPFRARNDEVQERLAEALTNHHLDQGTPVMVIRYTQIREYKVGRVEPAGWHHDLQEAE